MVSYIFLSGDCVPEIVRSGKENICSGQTFTITCKFICRGSLNQLIKDGHSLQPSNHSMILCVHVHSANKCHSGT